MVINTKIISRFKNAIAAFQNNVDTLTTTDLELLQWLGIDRTSKNIQEITYYTCLKMLSETLSKLPLKYYSGTGIRAKPDQDYYVLAVRPNKFMSATTFWSTVELNRNQYGNGLVLMRKRPVKKSGYNVGSELQDLWILPTQYTEIIVDDKGIFNNKGDIYYRYSDEYSGQQYVYRSEDVMHFKTFYTLNGIKGKSVQEMLAGSIDGALESQNFMNNLYKSGMTASMAMQYTGELSDSNVEKLQNKYSKFLCGSKNAGKIVPVPIGLQLQPLDIKPVDAQFFELKKYSALQIAGAFGIKPNQINNYEKSSYSNSEMQQLTFLVDTMLWILKQYEEEINYKAIGSPTNFVKFNEKAILRADAKTQMETIKTAVDGGLYTVNEGREYLDKPPQEGGDVLIVNGTYVPLKDVGKQYGIEKEGEENA